MCVCVCINAINNQRKHIKPKPKKRKKKKKKMKKHYVMSNARAGKISLQFSYNFRWQIFEGFDIFLYHQ